jgi:hypothetical protein
MSDAVDPIFYRFHETVVQHFSFLFAHEKYTVVAQMNDRQGEYQMEIAASARCQIKFILEREVFELYLGRIDAPRVYEDAVGGLEWWSSLWPLTSFEDTLRPDLAVSFPAPPGGRSLDGEIAFQAELLKHYLPRLEAGLSSSPDGQWWTEYRAFRAARDDTVLA